MGDYESALATLDEADSRMTEREPRDEFLLAINRGANLCHLQRHAEAAAFAATAMRVAGELENDLDSLRARWLQGRVHLGLGDRDGARGLLEEVRSQFLARSLPYDAALASLELSELYLQEGRFAEVREMTAELVALFESKNIHREALAALQLFQRAVVLESATAELARSLTAYLYRARYDPELRFSAAA